MKSNERFDALQILLKLFQGQQLTKQLQAKPLLTPFTKELCFGVARQHERLKAISAFLIKKPPKSFEVSLCIWMGLYQIYYLRTPDYAVVNETVALLEKLKKPGLKAFVNGVLRAFCRNQEQIIAALKTKSQAFELNHPSWLIQQIQKDWPNDWEFIFKANDEHPPMSLRVNQQKTSVESYLKELECAGIEAQAMRFSPDGITLAAPKDVHELPGFTEGLVSVQDEAAQLAVTLLDLKPNMRLLDACCAPGGKLAHSLEKEPMLSECVALDLDENRLKRVSENLSRLQLNARIMAKDASKPETWWDNKPFDRIILDAPCSALGVIRRHPDIKILRNKEDIKSIVILQKTLLTALWPLLAPGGIFLYATCSIMAEENEKQIAHFIQNTKNCQLKPMNYQWGISTGHGYQILPGSHNMDGFFYSVIEKTHA